MLKVLHLAAGNRWTGAAAPAFAETAALREAGIDAHYAYVGGYKLQAKLARIDYAHAIIAKAQNPVSFIRTAREISSLVERHGFDILHAHLTWDHVLASFVARSHRVAVARTFHARRVIRRDPFTRRLIRASALICVTNHALAGAEGIRETDPVFTPPPLDLTQFTPDGPDVRAAYGVPAGVPLIAVIGKVSKDRGFELAIETFAQLNRRLPEARFMIIGHGEHRPALERLAASLGVTDRLIWAGYHEDDLAEHYRAADVLLFTAAGSDAGHRAVLEAMACGAVPAVIPLEGVDALVEPQLIARSATASSLADLVSAILETDVESLRSRLAERCGDFSYAAAARRLIAAYQRIVPERTLPSLRI
jgi:glycosyltransferase involved in cell wall biosynthesis